MEIIPYLIVIVTYIVLAIFVVWALGVLYWFLCGDIIMRKMRISKTKSRE